MQDIARVMHEDHECLDRLFADVRAAARDEDWKKAAGILEQFCAAIERHMAVEETCLFPAFERHVGVADNATTALLRKGHRDLKVFFAEMTDAIAARDGEEFHYLAHAVATLLHQHDTKEEAEVYPDLAAALPDQGMAVMRKMQAG